MSGEQTERRRHRRVGKPLCTWLHFGAEHALYSTETLDVAPGGARFATIHEAKPGDVVDVCLQLEPNIVETKAQICWTEPKGQGGACFGVSFEGDNAAEREIAKYLERQTASV